MSAGGYVGKTVTLKGRSHRGKNRIDRGGDTFRVESYSEGYGHFLRSETVGQRECFWAWLPDDPNVTVIAVSPVAPVAEETTT